MSTNFDSVFAGLSGIRSESLSPSDRLKIAIVGKSKSGKSRLAATARKPMKLYDFDDRSESIAGIPGLLIHQKPTMLDVETDLSIFKARKIKKEPLPETIAFDTVTFMQRAMEDEIFRQAKELYREIAVGNSTKMKIRKGWDVINGIQRYTQYLITEFTALGVDLIFVYHEKNERDYVESTPEKAEYTGQLTVDPQYLSTTLSLFNEVYHIVVDGNRKYTVECKPNWKGNWNTTLDIDPTEEADILKMIAKHEAARAAKAAKAVAKP